MAGDQGFEPWPNGLEPYMLPLHQSPINLHKHHLSYIPQLQRLPFYLSSYFNKYSFIILYPKQLDSGINMGDIEQSDSTLIETISEQIGAIGKAGGFLRRMFR